MTMTEVQQIPLPSLASGYTLTELQQIGQIRKAVKTFYSQMGLP